MTNLLIIYEQFNPTEEIVIGALKEAQLRGICQIKALRNSDITAKDLLWSDIVFTIRGQHWLTAKLMKKAKRINRFCIAYWDDDYSDLLPGLVLSPVREKAFRQILTLSDAIVSPNPLLAEKLSAIAGGKRMAVFDTIVKLPDTDEDEPTTAAESDAVRMVYAAGIGHSMFFDGIIRPVLPVLCERFGGRLSITFVGVHPDMSDIHDSLQVEYVEHIPLKEFRAFIRRQRFDFGIAPLTEGGFFQYKYFNKFLEYALAGIPGIYSNCAPYTLVVEDGINGLLCENTPESWLSAIERMIEEPTLREKLCTGARETIRKRFSAGGVIERLLSAVSELGEFTAPKDKTLSLLWLKIGHIFFRIGDYAFYALLRVKQAGVSETAKRIVRHAWMRSHARESEKQI
ncbi:MAG: hypothetical protein C0413_03955 [Clostridiales bacterium]|nr:hypothetical protein [Clostridiales bacterium]